MKNFNKIKFRNHQLAFLAFLVSTIMMREISFIFYDINESPDIEKYIIYIEHFFDNISTNREHGLIYYYLHALALNYFFPNVENLNLALHISILNVNFFIYLFGLLGYYLLLRNLKFSKTNIYFTFIFLNFFPPVIAMRLMLKPEILAFSFVPWILFLFENFLKTKEIKFLFFSIPFFVSCISLKGNILVILIIYLFVAYTKIFFNLQLKQFVILVITTSILFLSVSYENNISNNKNLFDIQSGATSEPQYDFKAPKNIIYNVDLYNLISSPIKHDHAKSFIGITLLETNGDYFDLFWDNNASSFSKSRKPFITFIESKKLMRPEISLENKTLNIFRQRSTDVYLYENIGLFISIYLFFGLIIQVFSDKKFRKFYIAIFIGMLVILFHAITGIPKNNFDPLVGDTFKPIYYIFVFLLSFIFSLVRKFEQKKLKMSLLIIYVLSTMFLLGFPKNDYSIIQSDIAPKIESSRLCFISDSLFLKELNNSADCNQNKSVTKNRYYSNIKHKPINLFLIFLNSLIPVLIFRRTRMKNG